MTGHELSAADARHEVLVIRAKLHAASLVNPKRHPSKMTRPELDETWRILMDACLEVAALHQDAPAPSKGGLTLVAEDGELTAEGRAIVDRLSAKRAAERERRRRRRTGQLG